MRANILIAFLFLVTAANAQDPWKNVYSETAWLKRDEWQKAPQLLQYLHVKPGSTVADIGCHEGYMTVKLSASVGATGKVFAVDVDQTKLDKLHVNLEARKIANVVAVKGERDDPRLPAGALDAVLILDTYHEMKEHDKILQHIRQSLKPGGRLVLCEPIADERRKLSREEQEKKHELGIEFALSDLKKAGFQIVFQKDPFVDREIIKGDNMWIAVATSSK